MKTLFQHKTRHYTVARHNDTLLSY